MAVTRNIREYFVKNKSKQSSASIGAVWELMEQKADQFDPRVYITPIMETLITGKETQDQDILDIIHCIKRGVKEVVGTLIVEFGSVGYASKIEQVTLDEMAERYKKMGI